MERERGAARLDGEAGDIGARIAAARSRIAELQLQVLQFDANRIAEAEGEAREAQARETQVRERLVSVRARLAHMEVRAPISGEVFEMQVFAPAEVVRPAEPILKIVPEDAALVVRATLDPIHVDQVWPGQEATVLFPAFPARTTPAFEGRVLRVAADASLDERTGLAWYEVELAMGGAIAPEGERSVAAWAGRQWDGVADGYADGPGRWIARQEWAPDWLREALSGRRGAERPRALLPAGPGAGNAASALALTPGMPVEVYLRTGERSPLGYLVKPLSDYFSRALREEVRRGMAVRYGALCAVLAGATALALLEGCAVRPSPLTEQDTERRVAEDRRTLAANRPALDGPLTLHRAMAYALLFNLESRVRGDGAGAVAGRAGGGPARPAARAFGALRGDEAQQRPGLVEPVGADRAVVRSAETVKCVEGNIACTARRRGAGELRGV